MNVCWSLKGGSGTTVVAAGLALAVARRGGRPLLIDLAGDLPAVLGVEGAGPGITGWWQISGRSDRPMHQHTEDDLYYISHYSPWLDLKILLKTIRVVIKGEGAY